MAEHDSKSIIRQWDREIEDEIRAREAARAAKDGPWKAVVWIALWLLWLALLIGFLSFAKSVR